ncbi:MAG TPA: hypothetical protein VLI05_00225 [Candidatus Saccharimonadia bacterium]|nr:hypothetical protein [Candidatus Saccharimonadia bacterium]
MGEISLTLLRQTMREVIQVEVPLIVAPIVATAVAASEERMMLVMGQYANETTERFNRLETRMDDMEHRFDDMEHRFDDMEHRFDNLEQKVNDLGGRFEVMDRKFDLSIAQSNDHARRLARLEAR